MQTSKCFHRDVSPRFTKTRSEMPVHNRIEMEFGKLVFEEKGLKTGVPGEKPLGAEQRTKTNTTHISRRVGKYCIQRPSRDLLRTTRKVQLPALKNRRLQDVCTLITLYMSNINYVQCTLATFLILVALFTP